MFYFISSKFIPRNDNFFRNVFIIGSLFYIFIHAYLFSNGNNKIQCYRHYIYYIFLIDIALTCSYILLYDNNQKNNEITVDVPNLPESKYINENPFKDIEQNDQDPVNNSNIEDIHRRLLEFKAMQDLKLKQQTQNSKQLNTKSNNIKTSEREMEKDSPFAKKDNPKFEKDNNEYEQNQINDKIIDNNHDIMNDEINEDEDKYDQSESHVSIPLYKSDQYISDTDIPLYMDNDNN